MDEGLGHEPALQLPVPRAGPTTRTGDLVGILSREDFGAVDTSCLGLTPLPVAERAGLIWVVLSPAPRSTSTRSSAATTSCSATSTSTSGTSSARRQLVGPNWKVAYDGYLDFYHLPILHKNSFGPNFPNQALYDSWGPHQRVNAPNPQLLDARGHARGRVGRVDVLIGGVWTIFPHVSIAGFDAGSARRA